MGKALRVVLALSLSLWAAACSSIDVKQDWDPNADFAKLHTWAWQSSTPSVTGNARLDDPLLDARTIYTGYGPYRGWYGVGGAQTVVDDYDVGTLLVDFIDPDSNSVIWRGSAQSRLQELKTPEERQARVQAAVDQVLAQF